MANTRQSLYVLFLVVATVAAVPAVSAQIVVDREPRTSDYRETPDEVAPEEEVKYLRHWNRSHDEQTRWGGGRRHFGPRDAIRLVQQRGYHVRSVEDVGERFLVRARRGGDDLLVSVSRRGDIMGIAHDR